MSTRRVWIAQCLCPARHCILAATQEIDRPGPDADALLAMLREEVAGLLANELLNPWCGICGAPMDRWRYEVDPTAFRTMEEARPTLAAMQDAMLVTGALFGGARRGEKPN